MKRALLGLLAVAAVGATPLQSIAAEAKADAKPEKIKKFKPEWEDLNRYPQAEWLHKMKYGMYWHWGIPSITGVAGWYGRLMYTPNSEAYKTHTKAYGSPEEVGYKDLIGKFEADKFSAKEWIDNAEECGAKFVVAMGVHHDGFQMSKTKLHRWNSVDMKPHIDIVGELAEEAKKHDMKFGVSSHLAFNWEFFSLPMYPDKFDAKDAPDLYNIHDVTKGPTKKFAKLWYDRTKELIDNYDLDFLWFDFGTKEPAFNNHYTKQITADFYNQSLKKDKQVALAAKVGFNNMESLVFDVEHGKFGYTRDNMWMADCTLNDKWFNIRRPENEYSITGKFWTHQLIDIVSKNGTLLLNMGPNADGSWVPEWEAELKRMGKWLHLNGEAIYNSEPWHRFGEGPNNGGDGMAHLMDDQLCSNDVRFTRNGNTLYVIVCGWRSTPIRVKSLGLDDIPNLKIKSVKLLGFNGKTQWASRQDALSLSFPAKKFSEYAYVFKIEGENMFPERKEFQEIVVPLATDDAMIKNVKEVRISKKGKGSLQLAELYTMGSTGKGKPHNMARLGAPISSGCVDGLPAVLAFDNNLNGNTNMGSIARTKVAQNPYIGIKYDTPVMMSTVILYTEMNSRAATLEECEVTLLDKNGKVILKKMVKDIAAREGATAGSFGVE